MRHPDPSSFQCARSSFVDAFLWSLGTLLVLAQHGLLGSLYVAFGVTSLARRIFSDPVLMLAGWEEGGTGGLFGLTLTKFNSSPLKAMMGLEDDPASYWGPVR